MLIVLGDSNTTGFGLSDIRYSWMALAAQGLGTTWVSMGTNSATLQALPDVYNNLYDKKELFWEAVDSHPHSIGVIYPGTADIVFQSGNSQYNLLRYKEQLKELLQGVAPNRLVVVEPNTVTRDRSQSRAYQEATVTICAERGIAVVPTRAFAPVDGVHHGPQTQYAIAQRVVHAVKPAKL